MKRGKQQLKQNHCVDEKVWILLKPVDLVLHCFQKSKFIFEKVKQSVCLLGKKVYDKFLVQRDGGLLLLKLPLKCNTVIV